MKKLLVMLLLSLAPFTLCPAGQFSAAEISLDIPDGFEGPVSQSIEQLTVHGFTKPSSTGPGRTLLQLSAFDMGNAIPKLSREEMSAASDKYLLDFLKGVERRRTDFSQSKITHISLGDIPASKISWHGIFEGLPVNGVMYCVIVGGKIITLHTQDTGNEITPNMSEAAKAIESLVVTRKN